MNETRGHEQAGRLRYVDIFRAITIVLVVCGHCLGNNAFVAYIYGFHMPAFFFISGFTSRFQKERLITFSLRRVLTVLLPFFFYAMAFLSVKAILTCIPGYQTPFGYEFIGYGDALRLLWERGDVYSQPLGAIWFLPALFFAAVIAKVLTMITWNDKISLFVLSSALCALGFYLISINYDGFFWILRPKIVFIAQFFVVLGYVVGSSGVMRKLADLRKPYFSLILFAISLTASILFFHFTHFTIQMSESVYSEPTYFFVFSTCFGISSLLFASLSLSYLPVLATKPIAYIGRASLAIMIFHFLGMKLFGLLLVGFGVFSYAEIFPVVPPEAANIGLRIAYVIFGIAFSLGAYEGLRRVPVINALCGFSPKFAKKVSSIVDDKANDFFHRACHRKS